MIITVDREFGSGGRELGKRLSDALKMPCYDDEIIEIIAKECGLDVDYVAHMSENRIQMAYPLTVGRRLSIPSEVVQQSIKVEIAQNKLFERLSQQGDCVIVGRCADVTLAHLHPFRIFVYADRASKIARCQERAPEQENLTLAQLERKMRSIDRNRAKQHKMASNIPWGAKEGYEVCINTTDREIKSLIPALAEYVKNWFLHTQIAVG